MEFGDQKGEIEEAFKKPAAKAAIKTVKFVWTYKRSDVLIAVIKNEVNISWLFANPFMFVSRNMQSLARILIEHKFVSTASFIG